MTQTSPYILIPSGRRHPETGIITDEKLTRAAGEENSDPAVAEEFLAAETGPASPGGAGQRRPSSPACLP